MANGQILKKDVPMQSMDMETSKLITWPSIHFLYLDILAYY